MLELIGVDTLEELVEEVTLVVEDLVMVLVLDMVELA